MARSKTRFWESAYKNNQSFMIYYNKLLEIYTSEFKYENLPNTMDERFLELTLFGRGMAVLFEDEDLGHLGLPVMVQGGFNVYRIPIRRRAFAANGYQKDLTDKNSVIIYNNFIRTPSKEIAEYYAMKLWNIDRAIDVNVNAQKTPILLSCTETQRNTIQNAYKDFEGNMPVIFADKDAKIDNAISSITTGAPYVADKLFTLKQQVWNEALTYAGISNVGAEKKERMISNEVRFDMGDVLANRASRQAARQQAIDMYNRMKGTNIKVVYRNDVEGSELLDVPVYN